MKKTIFTIGSATFDIFVKPADQAVMTLNRKESCESWLCLTHGGKVKIETVTETFGGGAANTAIAFARMGFEAYPVTKIGEEYGDKVLKNLGRDKVRTDHVKKTSRDKTGFSTIISTLDGDRTVLGYAGANRHFGPGDLPLKAMEKADLIFLSHISGDSDEVLKALIRFLKKHPRIKLAWNPGHEQLCAGVKRWKELLKRTDILFVNKEEASLFTRMPYQLAGRGHVPHAFLPPYADDVSQIMLEFVRFGVKNTVITDGRNGAQCSDGKWLYFCPVVTQKRVDTLGAGDAFASGFTSAILEGKALNAALVYGTLNANSVVSYYGAQQGLLSASEVHQQEKQIPLSISKTRLK